MTKKIVLISAMPEETQGLFEKDGFEIYYSGIGKVNAAICAVNTIINTKCTHLINVGTAGSSTHFIHSVVEISAILQRDMDVRPMGLPLGITPFDKNGGVLKLKRLISGIPGASCGTGDSFVTGKTEIVSDVVDMELYAIAKACLKYNISCHSLKYITDSNSEDGHKEFTSHLKFSANALLDQVKHLISLL